MTFHSNKSFWRHSSRRATFELLESRDLLDGSGLLDEVRSAWPDLAFADNTNIYELTATQLSATNLRHALTEAMTSPEDDLIVLHTNEERHSFAILTAEEFNINVTDSGTLTIVSMGTSPLTIDAGNASRIFNFQGGTCQIGGLILTGGYTNTNQTGVVSSCGLGGALVNSGTLSLSQVTIENCSAGGLFKPTNASSFSKGGAIYNTGSLTLIDSVLANNTALSSGRNSFDTTAYGMGGALYNDNGTVVIRDTIFRANVAQAELVPYQVLVGETLETRYTRQEGIGGALYSYKGTITITGGTFQENTAWNGGGLVAEKSVLTCSSRVLFKQNSAGYNGGAVLIQGQNTSNISPSFDRCEFLDNVAKNNGGALASRTAFLMTNSIMSGNDAGVNGGAACLFGSHSTGMDPFIIEIVNSTITGNRSGTVAAGSGAGIYFSGIDDSEVFAKLYVRNSIIINNRDTKPLSLSNDPNLALKDGTGEYCFGNNTLTSFTQWRIRIGADNPEYNPAISPFRIDYNFDTKMHGDYQLNYTFVPVENNPAIGQGKNSFLDLNANPYDFYGKARIYGDLVDLGACEYHPTVFDDAFPTDCTVQRGCSFSLQCEGTDSQGNAITHYWVDWNGDGTFDTDGATVWMSWQNLYHSESSEAYFWLVLENSLGEKSESRQITVLISDVSPCIIVDAAQFLDTQIIKLALTVDNFASMQRRWTITWGDNTEPTVFNCRTDMNFFSHYYAPLNTAKTYNISLTLTNTKNVSMTFFLGTHTVMGKIFGPSAALPDVLTQTASTQIRAQEAALPLIAEESLSYRGTALSLNTVISTNGIKGTGSENTASNHSTGRPASNTQTTNTRAANAQAHALTRNSFALLFDEEEDYIVWPLNDDSPSSLRKDSTTKTASNIMEPSSLVFGLLGEDLYDDGIN